MKLLISEQIPHNIFVLFGQNQASCFTLYSLFMPSERSRCWLKWHTYNTVVVIFSSNSQQEGKAYIPKCQTICCITASTVLVSVSLPDVDTLLQGLDHNQTVRWTDIVWWGLSACVSVHLKGLNGVQVRTVCRPVKSFHIKLGKSCFYEDALCRGTYQVKH